ncbi:unnamed protein product [Prunus armeniaca]
MSDTASTDGTGASGSQPEYNFYFFTTKKNTRGPCRQLKTAKVTRVTNNRISIEYDVRRRAAPMAKLHSSLAHDVGHVVWTYCPMQWKSWKVMPDEMRTKVLGQLSTNYNLEDLDDESVALQEGCPKELEGREDSWAWLCSHFQESDYAKAAKANKGNRNKKTLLHHLGSRPFSYRMEARWRGINVFGDVYVRAGNELAKSLHRSQMVLHESASQLPPDTPLGSVDPAQDAGFQTLTETLDQTLQRRPGTYCRGMGNARRREPVGPSSSQSNQVTALTAEVAELKTQLASYSTQMAQMSQLLASIVRSGIPAPTIGPSSTSDSIQPKHGHHTSEHGDKTSAPIDHVQTSEPHFQNDDIDFGTLF